MNNELKTTERCRAKINLAIDVIKKFENGYHDVRMVMCQVDIFDYLTISLRGDGEILLESDYKIMPLDETNLACRAARVFFDAIHDKSHGCDIFIEKHIPVGAGMAGGSSDAAGVLNGLNKIFGQPLSIESLMQLGSKLGADIPFCVLGGCVLAEGIGDKLTVIKNLPKVYYVIAKPNQSVSTKWVYEHLDFSEKPQNLDVDGVVDAIEIGDLKKMYSHMGNVLENATVPVCPMVPKYKKILLDLGAKVSMMSGSGSAVFGIFESAEAANDAYLRFVEMAPDLCGVWLV